MILEHRWEGLHHDLMLEREGRLDTWAVAQPPGPVAQIAHELPAHRLQYLDYEGPVSGDRGAVRRIDLGTYLPVDGSTDDLRVVQLDGHRFQGRLTLKRLDQQSPRGRLWSLTFQYDR